MHQVFDSKGEHECVHGHSTIEHRHVASAHGHLKYISIKYASYTSEHNYVGMDLGSGGEYSLKNGRVVDHVCTFRFKFHQLGSKSLETYPNLFFLL